MSKFNVYYQVSGLKYTRYVLVTAKDNEEAKCKAKMELDRRQVKGYQIAIVEKSNGFYV